MRPTSIKEMSLVGVRVKDGRIVGFIFTTNLYRYPYIYLSKGEVYWVKALTSDLKLLELCGKNEIIEKSLNQIVVGGRRYKPVNDLPFVLKGIDIKNYTVYKDEEKEDYLVFAFSFPEEFTRNIEQPPVPIPR